MLAARHRARLRMQESNVDLQEGLRLRNVRRRLFQDDDETREQSAGMQDNITNTLMEEIRKTQEEAKEKWNFDFEKEEPLQGRYVWVKLDKDGNEIPPDTNTNNRIEESTVKVEETQKSLEKEKNSEEKDAEILTSND